MPKIRKETVDEIRRLGVKGYTNTEIGEQLGVSRGTARKYRVGSSSVLMKDRGELSLSDGILRRLYDLQGVLGVSSIADAVERAYRDEVSAMKFKLNLWEKYAAEGEEFSIEGLINKLVEYIEETEGELKLYMDGYPEDQKTIAELKEAGQARYDEGHEAGYEEARLDFALYIKCSYCGKPILIEPMKRTHSIIAGFLLDSEWGHGSCVNRAEYEHEAGSRALRAELMK